MSTVRMKPQLPQGWDAAPSQAHSPFLQVEPLGQASLHAPQLALSFVMLVHAPGVQAA